MKISMVSIIEINIPSDKYLLIDFLPIKGMVNQERIIIKSMINFCCLIFEKRFVLLQMKDIGYLYKRLLLFTPSILDFHFSSKPFVINQF